VRGCDVERELLDQPGEAWGLALRKIQDEAREGRCVDDRVFERAFQASTDEPRVERVVAVFDQHRPVREAQEGAAGIAKLRCADQHRPVDVVPPVRVRVDRRLAVDQRVEEGEWAVQLEALCADLEDQEWRVARALYVEGDELRVLQARLRAETRRVDGDLLPQHRLDRSARFEVDRLGAHLELVLASASARRAQPISSMVSPRSSTTAAP
jgi:hypothetical protein